MDGMGGTMLIMVMGCYGSIFNPAMESGRQWEPALPDVEPPVDPPLDTGDAAGDTGESGVETGDSGDSAGDTAADTAIEDTAEDGPTAIAAVHVFTGNEKAMAGMALATGDLNGDGASDLVIGAPAYDPLERDHEPTDLPPGMALLVLGPLAGSAATVRLVGATGWDAAGAAVAVGDVDGDAAADVVVGAPLAKDAAGRATGAVYAVPGPFAAGDVPLAEYAAAWGGSELDYFGGSLALTDWDNDGVEDVVVGSMNGDVVTVLTASPTTIAAPTPDEHFGFEVATGDLTGDGVGEIVVGTPWGNGGLLGTGMVYGFSREGEAFQVTGVNAQSWFGKAVAVGDVNNDGYNDLMASAPEDSETYLIPGPLAGNLNAWVDAFAMLVSDEYEADAGESVAVAGDRDGDGYADVVVSEYFSDPTPALRDAGRVWLLHGPFLGTMDIAAHAATHADGIVHDDRLGKRMAVTPDELIFAAPYASDGAARTGWVGIYGE